MPQLKPVGCEVRRRRVCASIACVRFARFDCRTVLSFLHSVPVDILSPRYGVKASGQPVGPSCVPRARLTCVAGHPAVPNSAPAAGAHTSQCPPRVSRRYFHRMAAKCGHVSYGAACSGRSRVSRDFQHAYAETRFPLTPRRRRVFWTSSNSKTHTLPRSRAAALRRQFPLSPNCALP